MTRWLVSDAGLCETLPMRRFSVLLVCCVLFALAGPAVAQEQLPPGGTFFDDNGSIHEGDIEGLAASGITFGCDERQILFCPERVVNRGEMAAFLDRALDLPTAHDDHFDDDAASIFAASINSVAAAGITSGCNPPENTAYCPADPVTREQMASFLVRALDLPPAEGDPRFTDTSASVHEGDIEALAAAGITKGCNPPDNDEYCPTARVTRQQMASFLVRAIGGLESNTPPPLPPRERVSRFTTYHNCCEPRVHNIQLLARTLNGYIVMPGEEFSINDVVGPRTSAKGYVDAPVLCSSGYCSGIGGGISQFATTMFNAIFWGGYDDVYHRPHSIWIDRYPQGIEATLGYPSLDVAFVNDTISPVVIVTRYTPTSITVELWGNAGGWQVSGYHPRGAESSVIDVIDYGGSDGRQVRGDVYGSVDSSGGSVRVERTITQHGESRSENWYWTYRAG